MKQNEIPLACNLSAHTPKQRTRHRSLLHSVVTERLEQHELANGYAFRFPDDTATTLMLAEYMTLERLCCPFLRLSLTLEADDGVWLEVTGNAQAKSLIAASFEAALA